MQELLDIHGQHETQTLLKQKYHLKLLDDYAENQYSSVKEQYETTFNEYKKRKRT